MPQLAIDYVLLTKHRWVIGRTDSGCASLSSGACAPRCAALADAAVRHRPGGRCGSRKLQSGVCCRQAREKGHDQPRCALRPLVRVVAAARSRVLPVKAPEERRLIAAGAQARKASKILVDGPDR